MPTPLENTSPSPAPGPSNLPQSLSPPIPAPNFIFNAPAELLIQEEEDKYEAEADPEDDLEQDPPPLLERDLTHALELLVNRIAGMPAHKLKTSIKPRVPNTFDSSNSNKLEGFIFQYQMYLALRSRYFPDDESRVTYVLSYLKGSPQDWF